MQKFYFIEIQFDSTNAVDNQYCNSIVFDVTKTRLGYIVVAFDITLNKILKNRRLNINSALEIYYI